MAITGFKANEMWAQHFGGQHGYSVPVQVPGVAAFCEVALHSTWAAGEEHHAADVFITQAVSASGVENFPTENLTGGDLKAVLYRDRVTSVTFKLSVFQAKGHARWIVYYWA